MSIHCVELQVGSDNDKQAIWGKLAECKRCKAKAQEEAQLEVERQEQAWLEEERACAEAEVQRLEAACKAEEARKAEQSWQVDALVGGLTGASSNVKVMSPCCLCCTQTNMFAWLYETYVKECFEFLTPDVPSDWDTTDEEDEGAEGLDEELEGLREEEEEGQSQSESGDQTGASSEGSQA
ncbi:hypothetical protein M404DRAFT_25035 [Pisolithus tinctorius Marx 270]|uniref:Uncharacterized protein n=1 Tax=Pisolithus tinctorius Marx 270 TaxID=870435 RepID=A0A0C3NY19_PISTI|nr:hypothetical protein M404DRAFT_25035 [Pisolithus tinctorius Marx 270]